MIQEKASKCYNKGFRNSNDKSKVKFYELIMKGKYLIKIVHPGWSK